MIDLASAFVADANVSVMCWETSAGRDLLDRAANVGATPVPLPRPRDPSFARAIVSFLNQQPADVFHIHVGTGRENFDGARAARSAGVPAVIQTQHLPWLLSGRHKRERLFKALEPVDRVIMVSEAQRRTYEHIGLAPERIITVPNGIRVRGRVLSRSIARAALGIDPDRPLVLTIGRLVVMKGHCYLVAAMPELTTHFPDVVLAIIGSGHLQRELAEQAFSIGISDAVRLIGHRPDARTLLAAADVFVLPSRHEGMPLVLLEAMDAGLPVVATRVVGSEEVVVDGETGFLVLPEDPPALTDAIGRLLEDADMRERFGAAGRRRFLEHFTNDRMAAATAAVYERVLSDARSTV